MEYTYKVHLYVVSQDFSLLMSPRDILLGSLVRSGLTLFALFFILVTASVVLLFTLPALLAEPSVGRVRAERREKMQGALGAADTFTLCWRAQQP